MRIVYLHQYFVTPSMAGGTRSYEMARRLVEAGHSVEMITSDRDAAATGTTWRVSEEAGVRVHWTPVGYTNAMGFLARLRAFVTFAWRAAARASSLDADLIFATSTPLSIAIPALWAARWRRRAFVFEIRDQWPDVPIALGVLRNPVLIALARLLEWMTYRAADAIVTLAPGMREDLIARGVPATKVSVIPNGCDRDIFAAGDPARLRTAHPWLGAGPLIVFAGTFGRVNGVEYVVRLASAVAARDPRVRFVLLGDGAMRATVERAAREAGLHSSSVFFLGMRPKLEVAEWVAAADMMLALFTGPRVVWKDAVQNKFFDALAAGRPVASNFRGWQSEIAESEGVGIILDPEDPAAAAERLLDTLRDPAWMAAARARARILASTRFDRDRLAGELEQLLRGVLTRRERAA